MDPLPEFAVTQRVAPGSPRLVVQVVAAADLAKATASFIADRAAAALTGRGRLVLAVSGGATPGPMLSELFRHDLRWDKAVILQVDERCAPPGHADRNLTDLGRRLTGTPAEAADLRPMPVNSDDVSAAMAQYGAQLREVAGTPPVIDVVQLGLGVDGHVASLVPDDPVLDVTEDDVALTREYQGRRRMTLTYPVINLARERVWMVAGAKKSAALRGLLGGDAGLPATRVNRDATVFTDDASVAP